MKKVAIVGGGLVGFHMAFRLLANRYPVTVYTNKTAQELRQGRMLSMAAPFQWVLDREKEMGIDFYHQEGEAGAYAEGFDLHIKGTDGSDMMRITAPFKGVRALGIDYRIKFAAWMDEFERRGGNLVIKNVALEDLENIAAQHDLTLLVTGRGPLSNIFEKDETRSTHDLPSLPSGSIFMKISPKINVKRPWADVPFNPLRFDIVPGLGDVFSWPFYTAHGVCRGFAFQSEQPGGLFDIFSHVNNASEVFEVCKKLTAEYFPENLFLYEEASIPDEGAWLVGATTPVVRKPLRRLSNGCYVLGVGDAAMIQDPYAGQSGNNGVRYGHKLVDRLLELGDAPITPEWMQGVFEEHWENYGKYMFRFCTLVQDPSRSAALMEIFMAAAQDQRVAEALVMWFSYPPSAWPYIEDLEEARKFIAQAKQTPVSSHH